MYSELILRGDGCEIWSCAMPSLSLLLRERNKWHRSTLKEVMEMECNSEDSVVERKLKNWDIHLPAEYAAVIQVVGPVQNRTRLSMLIIAFSEISAKWTSLSHSDLLAKLWSYSAWPPSSEVYFCFFFSIHSTFFTWQISHVILKYFQKSEPVFGSLLCLCPFFSNIPVPYFLLYVS